MPKPKPTDAVDQEDHTVVVDRSASAVEDHTVVVDRSTSVEADNTIVVDRSASSEVADHTVVVARGLNAPKAPVTRRRGMAAPAAPEGLGPGDIDEYVPRAIPDPPPLVEVAEPGSQATREPAPAMASVARRSRRGARLTLALFVVACIGAVAGLVAIILALVSR